MESRSIADAKANEISKRFILTMTGTNIFQKADQPESSLRKCLTARLLEWKSNKTKSLNKTFSLMEIKKSMQNYTT